MSTAAPLHIPTPCDLPGAQFYIPGCQAQLGQQANQATGGAIGDFFTWLINPVAAGQAAGQGLNQATGGGAQSGANAILDTFAKVTGAKSFVDLEQRGVLITAGIFFIFLGFIVLFFAHGGADVIVQATGQDSDTSKAATATKAAEAA